MFMDLILEVIRNLQAKNKKEQVVPINNRKFILVQEIPKVISISNI